jgi:hypothetical protein
MFRRIVFVVIFILSTIYSFSQKDSVLISAKDLKTACLIFNEHQKLSVENPLLKQQISSLEELNKLNVATDSIRQSEIILYKEKITIDEKQIKSLKASQKKIIIGSSIGGIVLFILGLLL